MKTLKLILLASAAVSLVACSSDKRDKKTPPAAAAPTVEEAGDATVSVRDSFIVETKIEKVEVRNPHMDEKEVKVFTPGKEFTLILPVELANGKWQNLSFTGKMSDEEYSNDGALNGMTTISEDGISYVVDLTCKGENCTEIFVKRYDSSDLSPAAANGQEVRKDSFKNTSFYFQQTEYVSNHHVDSIKYSSACILTDSQGTRSSIHDILVKCTPAIDNDAQNPAAISGFGE